MDGRRSRSRFAAEYHAARADAELGEVDPEHVWVLVVVRVQRKPPVDRGDRAQGPKYELATAGKDLDAGAHHGAGRHIREPARKVVPPADVAPDLGVLRNVGADRLVRDAEQVVEQPGELTRQPQHCTAGPVGEGHDADSVVGSHEDLRVEAREDPRVLDEVPAGVAAPEPQAHTRYPGIRLVVGLEHGGKRGGFEH